MFNYEKIITCDTEEWDNIHLCPVCRDSCHSIWVCEFEIGIEIEIKDLSSLHEEPVICNADAIVGNCLDGFGVCLEHLHKEMHKLIGYKKEDTLFIPPMPEKNRLSIINLLNLIPS